MQSVLEGVESKVQPKWDGPAQVVARESTNRYTVFFDDRTKVVNVERLKPYFCEGGSGGPVSATTPVLRVSLADPAAAAAQPLPDFAAASSENDTADWVDILEW